MSAQENQAALQPEFREEVVEEEQQPPHQLQVVNLDNISTIIKSAIEGVKEYMADKLQETKRQVLESAEVQFKFKGNKIQHQFNIEIEEKIQKAITQLRTGDSRTTVVHQLESAVRDVNERNKLIKLADRSEHGWKMVAEYKAEELAGLLRRPTRILIAIVVVFAAILSQVDSHIQDLVTPAVQTSVLPVGRLAIGAEIVQELPAYSFDGLIVFGLLVICTCAYMRRVPRLKQWFLSEKKGFMGVFYKASIIGTRLHLPVAICCAIMAVYILFLK